MKEDYAQILENIGLTKPEAKVYLSLIELKESQTGKLCEHSKIPSSNIYKLLNTLMSKGFISYKIKNNIKIFMPSAPETINELFKEKEKELEEERKQINNLIEELKARTKVEDSSSNYRYYEGINGVKSMWLEVSNSLKHLPKDTILMIYAGKKESYTPLLGFYDEFHKGRMKIGLKYHAIFPTYETKNAEKRRKQNSEIRFMEINSDVEWGIMGDKFVFQYITHKIPKAFLISDKIIASSFEQVFNQLWKAAKEN